MNAVSRSIRSGMVVATKIIALTPSMESKPKQRRIRSRDEHHDKRGRADQRRRSEIDFGENQDEQNADHAERNQKSLDQSPAGLLVLREPVGEKENRRDLRDFRWLEGETGKPNPAARAIDAQTERRHETEDQRHDGQAKPDPPGACPEMIIGERGERADDQPNPEPHRLAFHEKVIVAMAVLRERAGAEEHDDADDQHREHGQRKDVSALTMH